jgi:hypothetical protein
MIGMLEGKSRGSYERSMISRHCQVQVKLEKSDMSGP